MGRFFSDDVELALRYIFYDMRTNHADGQKGLALLTSAHERGDHDATYFLSRCYAGYLFVWPNHHFPVDDKKVTKLMRQSVAAGSAVGILGALRTSGVMNEAAKKSMPYQSLQEVWDIVYEKAEAGEPFCQYMIGNTYFWGDIEQIEEKNRRSFASEAEYKEYHRQNLAKCIPWFEKSFEFGVYFAGNNLGDLYEKGRGEFFSPQPEKAAAITRKGAEFGYSNYKGWYAEKLEAQKNYTDAFYWYQKSYEGGELWRATNLGICYYLGQGVEQNVPLALDYLEKSIQTDNAIGGYNYAGQIYYEGLHGIPQDYTKAVRYFEYSYKNKNIWGCDMLADCYLHGYGCEKNPDLARQMMEGYKYNTDLKNYCLGLIYADGLGVPENIAKGVEYLQKATKLPRAQQELTRFKKTLFGKWVRR